MKKVYLLIAGLIGLTMNLSAQQELIVNGSFEQGEQGWDLSAATNAFADFGVCLADDGDNYLWFGDFDELTGLNDIDFEEVSQIVTLPANLDFADFTFSWSGGSDEQDDLNDFDVLYIDIEDENGDLIYEDSISNADMDISVMAADCDIWYFDYQTTISSIYAGQDVKIIFTAFTDETNPTIFRIDNVSLLAFTTTGLAENKISEIEISPNPATNLIEINNLNNSDTQISIFNSAGNEIYSNLLRSGKNTIDISNLTPGFYYVKEQNGAVSKIVKQ